MCNNHVKGHLPAPSCPRRTALLREYTEVSSRITVDFRGSKILFSNFTNIASKDICLRVFS